MCGAWRPMPSRQLHHRARRKRAMRDVRRANTGLRIKNVGMSHEDEQNRSTEMSVNDGDEIARLPRCGSAACDQPALFGYRSYGDALTWYCSQHRLGQFWADAQWCDPQPSESANREDLGNASRPPFAHYCWCGKWGSFGEGVCLSRGETGVWFCAEHRPRRNGDDATSAKSVAPRRSTAMLNTKK